jgi:hypothetical protein
MFGITQPAPQSDPIYALQAHIATMPQVELPTDHYWADGMYCRVVARPAGTLIVGKVHRREHLYIVAKGRVAVYMGDGTREYSAGAVIVSKPGTKRAVLALEDSICMTVHRTWKRNLEKIERELIEPDDMALFDADNKQKFDPLAFRELTARVIAAEKPGFWSDWTPEQQRLYKKGLWREFSISRGYSESEIADYSAWRDMIQKGQKAGVNPYAFIKDLALAAARKNIALDVRGEIMLSSHAPFEPRD